MASLTLEVVLGMVDKASAPINAIIEKQSGLNKQINQAKRMMADNADAQKMIADYQKIEAQVQKAADAIALDMAKAQEKMAKLDERKAKSKTGTLGARDAKDYEQQQAKVAQLRDKLTQANKTLEEHKDKLKGVGINSNDLSGSMQKLTSEQDKNRASLERLVKQADRYQNGTIFSKINKAMSFNTLKSAATDVAVVGGAFAGLFALVKDTATQMDEVGKTAKRVNVPIEFLQSVRYQGQMSGVQGDSVDEALRDLNLELGEIQASGGGRLAGFLKETRQTKLLAQLKKSKDAQSAYGLMIEAINKQSNYQKKLVMASMAFGEDNAKALIPMINAGSQGIAEAAKELQSMDGVVSQEESNVAADFNDQLTKMFIVFEGIKRSVLTPIMKEMTAAMKDLVASFKNADWREAKIKEIGDLFKGLWERLKQFGAAIAWIIDNYQGLIAAIVAFKIAMIGLNAVMLANPVGALIAGIGLLVVGVVYLMQKIGLLVPVLETLWEWAKRLGAGIAAVFGTIGQAALVMVETILKGLAMLPDNMGGNWAKGALKDVEEVRKKMAEATQDAGEYAITGETTSEYTKMLRDQDKVFTSPLARSQSEVSVRILSDKPAVIDMAKTDGKTDLNVDTGVLMGHVF